jgi:hypothetical protein
MHLSSPLLFPKMVNFDPLTSRYEVVVSSYNNKKHFLTHPYFNTDGRHLLAIIYIFFRITCQTRFYNIDICCQYLQTDCTYCTYVYHISALPPAASFQNEKIKKIHIAHTGSIQEFMINVKRIILAGKDNFSRKV